MGATTTGPGRVPTTIKGDGFAAKIKKQGWWLPREEDPSNSSHFLLNGGKLAVSDDQNGRFLNLYFQSILRKEYMCVVERRTPIFRLFFDVDAKFSELADENVIRRDMMQFCTLLHDFVFADFFECSEDDRESIVCEAPPKSLPDGQIKFGLHIICPSVYVNTKIATMCRHAFLETCSKEEGEYAMKLDGLLMPDNPLHDVLDECVYRANGLRMPWSFKSSSEQRPYVPKYSIVTGGGGEDGGTIARVFQQDEMTMQYTRILLFKCSIRCCSGEGLTRCRNDAHLIADQMDSHKVTSGGIEGMGASIDMYAQAFPEIRRVMPAVYKNVSFVGKAFVTESAVMLKTNSRYCFNKGGEHATSTVYFCVTRHGVRQQCYCRKTDVRQGGLPCSEYRGDVFPLSKECLSVFFPDAFLPDPETQKMETSVSKRKSTIESILKRSRILNPSSSRKKKRSGTFHVKK